MCIYLKKLMSKKLNRLIKKYKLLIKFIKARLNINGHEYFKII